MPTFAELSETPAQGDIPALDRDSAPFEGLNNHQQFWRDNGYLVLPKIIPDDLIEEYKAVRATQGAGNGSGWANNQTAYMVVPQIKNLCLYTPVMEVMKSLIGDTMGMHLNLSGWVSTEREWHQDDYLNPGFINSWYCAAWFALGDIHADSGPFEFVPGSHKWPVVRGKKVMEHLTPAERGSRDWPRSAERFVTQAYKDEMQARGAKTEYFLGNKGDVLLWHGRLVHQGSKPNLPGMERLSLITHYSALSKRRDMPNRAQHSNGEWYFVF